MWSRYSVWTSCSVTCGGGVRTSSRVIVQQAKHGGKECEGGERDANNDQIKLDVEKCMARDENGNPKECPSKIV